MSECIHGLDERLCDVCSPKPVPVAPPKPVKARSPRASNPVPRSSRPAAAKRAPGAPVDKPVDVDAHRIFHLTHLQNLIGIGERGALLADAAGAAPAFDLSTPEHREQRRSTALPELPVDDAAVPEKTVPEKTAAEKTVAEKTVAETTVAEAGEEQPQPRTVADCVPFFATPESRLWADMRTGTPNPCLSATARASAAADYVMLATTVGEVERSTRLVLALDEASDPSASMTADRTAVRRELARLARVEVAEGERHPLASAELLAVAQVPIEAITLIGVANSKARDQVKAVLFDAGLNIRVAVYPPWFATP